MDRATELFNLMKWSNGSSMIFDAPLSVIKNQHKFEHKNIKTQFNTWK